MTHVTRGGLMALLVVAALALGLGEAMAAGCTPDGAACRRSRRCCGRVCVKAPGARSGVCCTPTGSEVCDGLDNDCNGTVDDGCVALCEDGDACTVDACSAGVCVSTPVSCEGGICVGGVCQTTTTTTTSSTTTTTTPCPACFADCDGNPSNGCETDICTQLFNCGGCGLVCD